MLSVKITGRGDNMKNDKMKALIDGIAKAKEEQATLLLKIKENEAILQKDSQENIARLLEEREEIDKQLTALGYGVKAPAPAPAPKHQGGHGRRNFAVGTTFTKIVSDGNGGEVTHKLVTVPTGFQLDGDVVYSSLSAATLGIVPVRQSGTQFWGEPGIPAIEAPAVEAVEQIAE